MQWRRADVTDPAALPGLGAGCDVVLHLAARVDGDADVCMAVHVGGASALLDEARRAGAGRILLLSTVAVYGAGPRCGIAVDEIEPAPVSADSQDEAGRRAAGRGRRRHSAAAGAGHWCRGSLGGARAGRVGGAGTGRVGGGQGLLSMVDARELARLITALARAGRFPGGT
ncbi:NAD-dependent epimerase/dehydratase family protein [Streptomyces sp. CG1]|uniref:NAD-dependent epimerase/dehydratase family protein n=1 Tax=Streptomyces sp. CG1 TaxID=1287523 RepID=UPI0034E20A17